MSRPGLSIPIPVFTSQPTLETTGDSINWKIGDKAWWTSRCDCRRCPCVIDSDLVGHKSALGDQCYEVIFPEEGGVRECVSAKQLRMR